MDVTAYFGGAVLVLPARYFASAWGLPTILAKILPPGFGRTCADRGCRRRRGSSLRFSRPSSWPDSAGPGRRLPSPGFWGMESGRACERARSRHADGGHDPSGGAREAGRRGRARVAAPRSFGLLTQSGYRVEVWRERSTECMLPSLHKADRLGIRACIQTIPRGCERLRTTPPALRSSPQATASRSSRVLEGALLAPRSGGAGCSRHPAEFEYTL